MNGPLKSNYNYNARGRCESTEASFCLKYSQTFLFLDDAVKSI